MNRRTFIKSLGIGGAGLSSLGLSLDFKANALSHVFTEPGSAIPSLQTFYFDALTVDQYGLEIARRQHQANFFTQDIDGSATLDMVLIPQQRYLMGAAETEIKCGAYECLQHRVGVKSFFMGKTPVTQRQWRTVSRLPRIDRELLEIPSYFAADDHPVESVSWLDAQEFCARLSVHSGINYCLPSEAAWESACRAGTTTPFHCGSTLTSELANYNAVHTYAAEQTDVAKRSTTPVGRYLPNAYGLYDMHGNVWEWCADHWHANYRGAPQDDSPWVAGGYRDWRALRGGAWADAPAKLRSASRSGYAATSLNRIIGFRISAYFS